MPDPQDGQQIPLGGRGAQQRGIPDRGEYQFGQLSFLIIPFWPNLVFCDDPFVNYEYSGARHDFPVENLSLNSLKAVLQQQAMCQVSETPAGPH